MMPVHWTMKARTKGGDDMATQKSATKQKRVKDVERFYSEIALGSEDLRRYFLNMSGSVEQRTRDREAVFIFAGASSSDITKELV
jgi:hypothetical protein